MKITFTKQQLLDCSPCGNGLAFAKSCKFDFAKIYDTCERGDWLIWLLRKSKTIDQKQYVLLACACAEHTLQIFEKKNPNNKQPRKAIESARKWTENPTEENKAICYAAADADAAAAYADAAAADATTYAAYAADAAAYAATTYAAYAAAYADAAAYAAAAAYADAAAYAAADAAYAAADADADVARTTEHKWQANKIREIIPNPFI
jgi:hypothetical protein